MGEGVSLTLPFGSTNENGVEEWRNPHNLGPFYTSINAAMTLVILLSLKTTELLQIGVANHSGVTALFSIRPISLASSQHCHNVDADAQYKRAQSDKTQTTMF